MWFINQNQAKQKLTSCVFLPGRMLLALMLKPDILAALFAVLYFDRFF